jgi:hypothetical protein
MLLSVVDHRLYIMKFIIYNDIFIAIVIPYFILKKLTYLHDLYLNIID